MNNRGCSPYLAESPGGARKTSCRYFAGTGPLVEAVERLDYPVIGRESGGEPLKHMAGKCNLILVFVARKCKS